MTHHLQFGRSTFIARRRAYRSQVLFQQWNIYFDQQISTMGYFQQIIHCKSERSVLALKMGTCWWVKYIPVFESIWLLWIRVSWSGLIQSNYLGLMLIWTQGLKWNPGWTKIAFWWGCFGLSGAQMAPGGAETDFGMQGWIGTLGLKQTFYFQYMFCL